MLYCSNKKLSIISKKLIVSAFLRAVAVLVYNDTNNNNNVWRVESYQSKLHWNPHRIRASSSSSSASYLIVLSVDKKGEQGNGEEEIEKWGSSKSENELSDLDARVLQSLLEEQPDLAMETNLKRLLLLKNNNTTTNTNNINPKKKKKTKKYASQILSNQEENTSWWNSWRVKASSVLESVGIMVRNKIERDIQVTLAIPTVFWDRISRETVRILPSSSSSSSPQQMIQKLFLLPPTSSSQNLTDESSLYEYLSNPQDKLQAIVSNLQEIINSPTSPSSSTSTSKFLWMRGDQQRRKPRQQRTLSLLLDSDTTSSDRAQRAYQVRKRLVLDKERRQQQQPSTIIFQLKDALVDGSNQLQQQALRPSAGTKTRSFLLSSSSFIVPRLPTSQSSKALSKVQQLLAPQTTISTTNTLTNTTPSSTISTTPMTTATAQMFYPMENTYFASWVEGEKQLLAKDNQQVMFNTNTTRNIDPIVSSASPLDKLGSYEDSWTFVDVPFEEKSSTYTTPNSATVEVLSTTSSFPGSIADVEVVVVDEQDIFTTTTSSSTKSTTNIPFAEVPSQEEEEKSETEALLTTITLRTFDIIFFLVEQVVLVRFIF